ncbi:hypothetical protein HY641_02325 [Candidatus Woesearchaeota archaeon]|nr:hypothetical protein [Candidatus Woesearchaeota archaeon]
MQFIINITKTHAILLTLLICAATATILVMATGFSPGTASHPTLFTDIIKGRTGETVRVQDAALFDRSVTVPNLTVSSGLSLPSNSVTGEFVNESTLDCAAITGSSTLCDGNDAGSVTSGGSCVFLGPDPTGGFRQEIPLPACMDSPGGCRIVVVKNTDPMSMAEMHFVRGPSDMWVSTGTTLGTSTDPATGLPKAIAVQSSGIFYSDARTSVIADAAGCMLKDDTHKDSTKPPKLLLDTGETIGICQFYVCL